MSSASACCAAFTADAESESIAKRARRQEVFEQIQILARGSRPWDAEAWLQLREDAWGSGCHDLLSVLLDGAKKATGRAIEENRFLLPTGTEVDLMHCRRPVPSYRWLGSKTRLSSLQGSKVCSEPASLMFTAEEELEVGHRLAQELQVSGGPAAVVVVSSEVSHFTEDGLQLDFRHAASRSPEAGLSLRTDFEPFLERAAHTLMPMGCPRDLLAAVQEPYLLLCRSLTSFRASCQTGFQFLEKPSNFHMVLRARPFRTVEPEDRKGLDYFSEERQRQGLLERLNLVALAALEQAREEAVANKDPEVCAPHVVLGIRPSDYPSGTLATALQEWHQRYSQYFASMVVACGCAGSSDMELLRRLELQSYTKSCPHGPVGAVHVEDEKAEKTSTDVDSDCESVDPSEVCKGLQAVTREMERAKESALSFGSQERRPRTAPALVRRRPSGTSTLGDALSVYGNMKQSATERRNSCPGLWGEHFTEPGVRNSLATSSSQSSASRQLALDAKAETELAKQQPTASPDVLHAKSLVSAVATPLRPRKMAESEERAPRGQLTRRAAGEMLRARRGSSEAKQLKEKLEALRTGAPIARRRSFSSGASSGVAPCSSDITPPISEGCTRSTSLAAAKRLPREQRPQAMPEMEIARERQRPLTSR
eukprot:TRINITY_DN50743_c0_g1_i1.p1 TRINITY_DN50743_c0_g1~~TRINITY_DN50743_c0_g1_i1.p1  ORF type:complete len:653 (-),score=128.67 TRINITY_DN50743_c0_g1_i1:70-2028(-)